MTVHSGTATTRKAGGCGCGSTATACNGGCRGGGTCGYKSGTHAGCTCDRGEDGSCRLDCIERPRFFCGQLLTDADLTSLVDWTRDRLRLTRYRDGWGVVCGLEVRCDPQNPGRVLVGTGYAINCCGDDIVICKDTPYDLSLACQDPDDPCADLWVDRTVKKDVGTLLELDPTAVSPLTRYLTAADGLRVVDLVLRYREEPGQPQTSLARGACKEVGACEYGRVHEGFALDHRAANLESDPTEIVARRWHEAYERCLDVLVRFQAAFPDNVRRDDLRRWLLQWIARYPLQQLCWVRELICDLKGEETVDNQTLVLLLLLLVQDRRNAFLHCECASCERETGVPLARVWLKTMREGGRQTCHVLQIDSYPPFRRPLHRECWPAPLGSVNLGRLIWHRQAEACTELADLGIEVAEWQKLGVPETLRDLEELLRTSLFVGCGDRPVVQVIDMAELGRRVVGFGTAIDKRIAERTPVTPSPVAPATPVPVAPVEPITPVILAEPTTPVTPPAEAPSLDVSKTGPEQARIGEQVTIEIVVKNTGNVDLDVTIKEQTQPEAVQTGEVAAGAQVSVPITLTVPETAEDRIDIVVMVTGTTVSGLMVAGSATHALRIDRS